MHFPQAHTFPLIKQLESNRINQNVCGKRYLGRQNILEYLLKICPYLSCKLIDFQTLSTSPYKVAVFLKSKTYLSY